MAKVVFDEQPEMTSYIPSLSEVVDFKKMITEEFKGEVENKPIKVPEELGEEHPFDFKVTEGLYKKFGLFTAVIDKYVDFVVGPGFYIDCKDERAKKILEDFMRDVNFDIMLRRWTKEALIKGNGFLEIGGDGKQGIEGLKILNADYMYVKRDKFGVIKKYNQYTGGFNKFEKKKVIEFEPNQIAHVPFNIVGDNAYGIGIGYSALQLMDNLIQQSKDMHWLLHRKANSPLHAKLGKVDGNTNIIPKADDVTAFGKKMEIMSEKTNWATDPLVELGVVDFGNVGDKFKSSLEYDLNMLIYAFQVPGVLLGMANINQGVAKVELESFQRRIQSIQAELEKIIENQIFKRILDANGLDVEVEFEWGSPSVIEVEGRMQLVSDTIKSSETSYAMKGLLEDEFVRLLKLDEDKWERKKEEQKEFEVEEREREEERPLPIVPGQNKTFPQKPAPKKEQPKQPKPEEMFKELKDKIDNIKPQKEKVIIQKTSLIPNKIKKKVKEANKVLKVKRDNINYEYKKECAHCTESVSDITDIKEWIGFNYKEYLGKIIKATETYDFNYIKAITEIELEAGYLTEAQILELRGVLKKGFEKGQGLKEISKAIDKKVQPKDLYRMTAEGEMKLGAAGLPILAKSSNKRAMGIARSEVTRLANMGAVEHYKDNGIKKVSWIASIGDRTCPTCESLDGQIYEINQHPAIPVHPMCRCTLSPVTEIR